jgi:outer membrane protein OmpA-like peptidoglycan-associated protein
MRHFRSIFILLILFITPHEILLAQQDVDGSGDHPLIERVAGSYIFTYQTSEYERIEIPTGPATNDGFESIDTMEGEYFEYTYRFEDKDVSTMRVKASYRDMLEENGFDILFAGSEDELGFRDGAGLLMQGDYDRPDRRCCSADRNGDIRYLAAKSGDGNVLMSLVTFKAQLGMGTVALVDVVQAEAMETSMDHQPLSSEEMSSGIEEHGRIAVQNILFETDSDEILPESADALGTIAKLMNDEPEMTLLVVGHTDNTGNFDYNVSLSMDRASSVVSYLVDEMNISDDRLQAAGAGMMAPTTTNRTEEGRSLNRRVELVEIQGD